MDTVWPPPSTDDALRNALRAVHIAASLLEEACASAAGTIICDEPLRAGLHRASLAAREAMRFRSTRPLTED